MSFKKKYKAMFLGNVKIGYRLLALVVFMLMLLVAIGTLGIIGMKKTVAGTDMVYKKNVVPLKDLQTISDTYAINIVKSVQRIRDDPFKEKLLWQGGLKSVDSSWVFFRPLTFGVIHPADIEFLLRLARR